MSINYNQQLLQAASLTAKTALLKKGLKNSNEVVKGFKKKMSSVTRSESESDPENFVPASQFSPLASSTQQVKKRDDSTSEDSDTAEVTTNKKNAVDTVSEKSKGSRNSPTVNIISNKMVNSSRKSLQNSVSSSSDSSDSEMNNSKSKSLIRNREDIKRMLSLKKNEKNNKTNVVNSKPTKSSDDESDSSSSSNSQTENSKSLKNSTVGNSKNHSSKNDQQAPQESEDESSSSTSEDDNPRNQKNSTEKKMNYSQEEAQKSFNQSKYKEVCDSDSDEPQNNSMEKSNSHQQVTRTPIETFKRFLEENPEYERTKIKEKSDLSGIDSDDEVYLLRIPKTVDPKILQGMSFSLTKKSKIRTESGKYVINKESDSSAPLLVYSNTLKRINPVGTFKMEKYLRTEDQGEILIEEKKKQPLPENIKVRHPLFGPDYESKIQLEEQIREKLQQALQRFQVKEKPKKKKHKVKEDDMEDKSLLISRILEERFNTVRHSQSSNCSEESGMETKKKKKKNKSGDSTVDGADQSVENMSREVKVKKKKKHEMSSIVSMKQELETQDESEMDEKLAKKKKRKNGTIDQITHQENDITIEHVKKKKRKDNFENSDVLKTSIKQEIQTELETQDESEMETPKKKKKKKKKTNNTDETNHFSEVDQSSISGKKKDSFIIPNIKQEIESQDEDAPTESPSKKKKKSKDLVPEISVKIEPSDESVNAKSKKRRKSILNSTEIMGDMSTTLFKFDVSKIEREEPVSKKSKKKKDGDDLINSLLSNAKTRLDSGSEKKAHKRVKGS